MRVTWSFAGYGLGRKLRRLLWDERGNTAMIMAAAIVPLLGLVGSALDMSRTYLVKSKLQAACDAGALGARRAMADATLDDASKAEGKKFFDFNFPAGTMQSSTVNLLIKANDVDLSTVDMTASTTVPTTIMKMFGISSLPVAVACSADQDYVNNDIMMVLDVTGSMNCSAGTACDYAATEQSGSRLSRLRTATVSLYDALAGAKGVRTRYGFMPYSMTVNTGADLGSAAMLNPSNYWQKPSNKWNSVAITHPALWFTTTWTGCIEERSTLSQGSGSTVKISSDVAQGDIDTGPTSAALKWAPYDTDATVGESGAYPNLTIFCPAAAKRLAVYASKSSFQTAATAALAKVGGYTNHDLGVMWGMRYLSSSGMYAADNPTIYQQVPVSKHIIFLTDGVMTADSNNYSSFGIPAAEDRMTGGASLVQKHKDRFLNACARARSMGMTIWVVALDVQTPSDISPCASGSDHFFVSDGSDLDSVFTRIGKGIGRLRLTQ